MALKLMTYGMVIKYRKGADNCNADGVSQQVWAPELDKKGAMEDPVVVFDLPESGLGRVLPQQGALERELPPKHLWLKLCTCVCVIKGSLEYSST